MTTSSPFELRLKEILSSYSLPGSLITMGTTTFRSYFRNSEGNVLLAEGNVVPPDGGAGYAKGCIFLKNDAEAGVSGFHVNVGTTEACSFKLLTIAS